MLQVYDRNSSTRKRHLVAAPLAGSRDRRSQFVHVGNDQRPARLRMRAVLRVAMTSPAKADRSDADGDRRIDTRGAVLDHQAAVRCRPETLGSA
jgi:hypothetical protein